MQSRVQSHVLGREVKKWKQFPASCPALLNSSGYLYKPAAKMTRWWHDNGKLLPQHIIKTPVCVFSARLSFHLCVQKEDT